MIGPKIHKINGEEKFKCSKCKQFFDSLKGSVYYTRFREKRYRWLCDSCFSL